MFVCARACVCMCMHGLVCARVLLEEMPSFVLLFARESNLVAQQVPLQWTFHFGCDVFAESLLLCGLQIRTNASFA